MRMRSSAEVNDREWALEKCIRRLSEFRQRLLHLCYRGGLQPAEIASELRQTVTSV